MRQPPFSLEVQQIDRNNPKVCDEKLLNSSQLTALATVIGKDNNLKYLQYYLHNLLVEMTSSLCIYLPRKKLMNPM